MTNKMTVVSYRIPKNLGDSISRIGAEKVKAGVVKSLNEYITIILSNALAKEQKQISSLTKKTTK